MGYHKVTKSNFRKTFIRLDLSAPRPVEGKETSYEYSSNNYTVKLHTTYLENERKWRDNSTDAGWVLIAEGDEAKYFARPFKRTKGFVLRFLLYARVTKWKIDNRPLCKECKDFMNIKRKRGSRQYYWGCFNNKRHSSGNAEFLSWDEGLSKEATEILEIRRLYAEKYNAKNKKNGKIPTPAAVKRKKWPIGNPENLVRSKK